MEAAKPLHARIDAYLSSIADDLRARDAELKLHTHDASYYALREQVYRCAELLKAAQFRLSQKNAPQLGTGPGPSAVKRKFEGYRNTGWKQTLYARVVRHRRYATNDRRKPGGSQFGSVDDS